MRSLLNGLTIGLLAAVVAGCGGNFDPNATPISLFPTAIPKGSPFPTFISFATPGGPTAVPVTAAGASSSAPLATNTPLPTFTPSPVPPTAIPTLDANWLSVANGIAYRNLTFKDTQGNLVGVLVARIDPTKVNFQVAYIPGQTKTMQNWPLALPGAALIVNGNYFDPSGNPLGLLATNGNLSGFSNGRTDSGFFQVNGGIARVRSLFLEPFNNTEHFDQLLQGFPMLMVKGQVAPAFNGDLDNTAQRRTVIAQDIHGNILIIVTPLAGASFKDMAAYLGVSGLQIDSALNLDGGASTSMYLQTGGPSQYTYGISVPVVLAVFPH